MHRKPHSPSSIPGPTLSRHSKGSEGCPYDMQLPDRCSAGSVMATGLRHTDTVDATNGLALLSIAGHLAQFCHLGGPRQQSPGERIRLALFNPRVLSSHSFRRFCRAFWVLQVHTILCVCRVGGGLGRSGREDVLGEGQPWKVRQPKDIVYFPAGATPPARSEGGVIDRNLQI